MTEFSDCHLRHVSPSSLSMPVLAILAFLFLQIPGGFSTFYFLPPHLGEITSDVFNYPNHTSELDVIWMYTHSVHIEVSHFQLDGQSGDFLLVSDLPLTFEDSFVAANGSERRPDFLAESILTTQGLLLSWDIREGSTFHILSKHGSFIYFHAEFGSSRGLFPYKGFNITVRDLDEMRTPPPTTTTEGTQAPPEPSTPIYLSKYLLNNAFLVRERKDELKGALAYISNQYCWANWEGCGQYLTSNITAQDVNIPSDRGLHMCDMTWDSFETCVEITFAITREEENTAGEKLYLMPLARLREMWEGFSKELAGFGFTPYDNHPAPYKDLNTWVWIASISGLVIFLMIPLCFYWVIGEVENKGFHSALAPEETEEEKQVEKTANLTRWRDLSNPVRPFLEKLKRNESNVEDLQGGNSNYKEVSEVSRTRSTKQNVLFQEQEVEFEYDNGGYIPDPESALPDDSQQDGLLEVTEEEYTHPAGTRFLRIQRTTEDENSDTEI